MAGEIEPYGQSTAEIEFGNFPEEIRRAALEYARGLYLDAQDEPLSPAEGEDVQFILVGVQQHGRAVLFASTAVAEAKFAGRIDGFDRVPIRPGGPVARVPRRTILVGAKMTSFDQIIGDDYRGALASLMHEWDRRAQDERERLREIDLGEQS